MDNALRTDILFVSTSEVTDADTSTLSETGHPSFTYNMNDLGSVSKGASRYPTDS